MRSSAQTRLLIALGACVASAAGHNLVRIRGETSFERGGILIRTTWSDRELEAFRVRSALDELPSVGNLNEALTIGAALAESLCYTPAPGTTLRNDARPRGCARAELVQIESMPEVIDDRGRVEREHGWRLTHRIAASPEAEPAGDIAFLAVGDLRSHPVSLLLAMHRAFSQNARDVIVIELTPASSGCSVLLERPDSSAEFLVSSAPPKCGFMGDGQKLERSPDHRHNP